MSHDAPATDTTGGHTNDPVSGRSRRPLFVIGGATLVVLAVLFLAGWLPRVFRDGPVDDAASTGPPRVAVVMAVVGPTDLRLTLPASIQAQVEAPIYARAEGYVSRRLADMGDIVKQGQVLAEISSPELDQQVLEGEAALRRARSAHRQSQSQLAQARANLELAEVTAERWNTLVGKGVLSKQDGDEKRTVLAARQADEAALQASLQSAVEAVTGAEASLARLTELKAFRQLRAPFDGLVTARDIDVGSLVSPGSGTSARELFRVADVNPLRAHLQVPQGDASAIRPGMRCEVSVIEFPRSVFPGVVTRTAGSLDPVTRTLLVEIELENPGQILLPGMYGSVTIPISRAAPPVMIPASAYRTGSEGPRVAIVDSDNTVRFRQVTLGRDLGAQIEVLEGIKPGEKVATTLTDSIREGTHVSPVVAKPPAAPGAQGSGPGGRSGASAGKAGS